MIRTLLARFRNRQKDNILSHGTVYFAFFMLTTVANIVFRKYTSSSLSIADFGAFTALMAFYSIISQPFGVLQMYITKRMALSLEHGKGSEAFAFFRGILRTFFVITLVASALVLLASPFLQAQYHLPTLSSILLVIVIFFVANIASCYTGGLQALQRFSAIGAINLATNLLKIAALVALVALLPSGGGGVLLAYDQPFLAFLVSLLALLLVSRAILASAGRRLAGGGGPEPRAAFHLPWREMLPIFLLILTFSLMKNTDEYFARHFLDEHDNGLYGALVTIGKSSIFLVSSIVFVVFPKFASKMEDARATRRIMLKGIVLSIGGSLGILAVILLFPEPILRLLTHAKYLEAAGYLKWFFLAYLPYPIILLFINYFTVHRSTAFTAGLLAATVLEIVFFQFFHDGIATIITVMGATGWAILAVTALFWWHHSAKSRRAAADRPA